MVSKAADKLEQIAAYMDLIGRTDYAGFLRNVAALVRACEAKQEDMQNAGQDFYGDDILAAIAKLQEGE